MGGNINIFIILFYISCSTLLITLTIGEVQLEGSGSVIDLEFNNSLISDPVFVTEPNGTVSVSVGPLDPEELEESARQEEEEMEDNIMRAEEQMEEIIKAEAEQELGLDLDVMLDTNATVPSKNLTMLSETGTGTQVHVDPHKRREEIKAKAVQNLMQIFGLSASQVKEERHGPAPEFMIDLYNTITDASGVTRAKNPFGAHVVRSFLEKDASINEFFFFNISALEGTETVLEAELHLFRMDTPRAQLHPSLYLNPFYVLSLYQVIDPAKLNVPDLHKLLAVHYVPALGSGWQVFNVKKAVVEWLTTSSENHGFLVSAESVHGDRVPIRFARRSETAENKQPILVLFNHDSRMATIAKQNEIIAPPRKKVLRKKVQDESTTNEAEDDPNDPSQYTYETTTPLSSLENPRFHHSLLFQDSIRHPNSVGRFRNRRSRNETATPVIHPHNNFTECGLHDLFVSFESIGWTSWIISPKGYNAHYCDGPCVFPLGKEARPTNHATVQSIINQLNLHPGLSRPCCVPTTLLPISLLYYDDQDNVVLKQYVDMVAESCGCH